MARKILYQTLQDWNNPEYVRENGPFICVGDDAWLCHGYYFWGTFLHLGHWWGETQHKNKYIICKAECDFNANICFDLHGEPEHMELFDSIVEVMKNEGLIDDDVIVSEVIQYLKTIGVFQWKASRVTGVHTISEKKYPDYTYRMKFVRGKNQFIDYKPAIQICIYDLEALKFKNLEIIYPDKYKSAI